MPINFPNSPTTNQLYTYDNKTWQWNGVYWGVYSALTSYITSAYTAGDGVSDISGVTNGNLVLKSFSGVGLTITDSGDKLTFISSGSYLPTSGGTVTGNTIFTSGLTATTLQVLGGSTMRAITPEIDSTYNIGSSTFRYNNIYTRAILSGPSSLDLYSTLFSFYDSVGNRRMTIVGSSGNVIIGSSATDAGYRLDVNGTARIQNQLTTTGSINASAAIARGTYLNQTLVATANNDVLVGLDIQSTFTPGAFTGVAQIGIRTNGSIQSPIIFGATYLALSSGAYTQPISFYLNQTSTLIARFFGTTGNLTLQNGGTFTDAGYRLDVIGTTRLSGNTLINGEANVSFLSLSNNTAVNNSGTILILGASGAWTGVRVPRYFETTGTISAATAIARGTFFNQTLVATANNDVLVGLDIAPTFTTGGFTGVQQENLVVRGGNAPIIRLKNDAGTTTLGQIVGTATQFSINAQANTLSFVAGNTESLNIFASTRNVLIQNGGTFTDTGFRLDVNGTTKLRSTIRLGSINQPSAPTLTTNSTTGGTLTAATYFYRIVAVDFFGSTTTPSNELSVTTTGSTSSITLAWAVVSGAYSYRIYRGTTSGGQNLYYTVNGTNTTSFTDTGAAGTAGTTPTENLTAYGSYSTSSGDFRSGNITIVNNGIGNYSSILFDKSTDTPAINVVEYSSDSTMFEFSLSDNPDGVGDFFHWVLPDWQNPSSGWKPLKFANLELQFIGSTSNFWSSFLLPSSTPYYTTNPASLANSSIKWNPYTSNTYNLIKDSGTGTGNLNVEISGFTGTINRIYWVTIQSGAATFNWGINSFSTSPIGTGVAITGGWQTLDNGTQIRITGAVLAGDRWSFRAFPIPRLGVGTTTPTSPLQVSSISRASGAIARGVNFNPTLVATANNDTLVGLDIQPTFTNGAFSGVTQIPLRIGGNTADQGITFSNQNWMIRSAGASGASVNFNGGVGFDFSTYAAINTPYRFLQGFTTKFMIAATTGNILVNTTTDLGYRLDVNGTGRFVGTILSTGAYSVSSGTYDIFNNSTGVVPTSGNMVVNGFAYNSTINQTGGASGITRGVYINPTLTSAYDFRAIETTIGNVMLNTVSGNTLIGKTTDSGQKLQVSGNTLIQGSLTANTVTTTGTTTALDFYSSQSSGDEGGEIRLNRPETNTTVSGGTTIDMYQNRLRIFESGGTNRGVFIDLTKVSSTVGTNLVVPRISSGVDSSGNTTAGAFTIVSSVIVPANTFATGDVVSFKMRMRKSGTNGTVNYRMSANSTLNLTGSQTIGVFNAGATIVYGELSRTLVVKGATSEVFNTSITNVQNDVLTSTSAVSSLSIDWTVDQYIMFNINQSSNLDTTNISYYSILEI